jgi:hypothetical protein
MAANFSSRLTARYQTVIIVDNGFVIDVSWVLFRLDRLQAQKKPTAIGSAAGFY